MEKIKIVDLFAGIGGLRTGTISALTELGYEPEIVFTSEIKPAAITVLKDNHPNEKVSGDITLVDENAIPDHDVLLAGFPCQAFSFAGSRRGFADSTKGTLFFDVARILREKNPEYFILENVEGLLHHDPDPDSPSRGYGRTFTTILDTLDDLGYSVDWDVLTATDFGVPQTRKRVFIVGSKNHTPDLAKLLKTPSKPLSSILETGHRETDSKVIAFADMLVKKYPLSHLEGKTIRDKRGGSNNLHSWNIESKGATTQDEKELMEEFLVQTRRRSWAIAKGKPKIECVPLEIDDIRTFAVPSPHQTLEDMLKNLTRCGYLIKEGKEYRIYSGRLSFPLSHILDPNKYAQTLVATDADRMGVVDSGAVRRLTNLEIKRLFGFQDDIILNASLSRRKIFDLFGNSVVVPVAAAVAKSLIKPYK